MLQKQLSRSTKRIICKDCTFFKPSNGICKFNRLNAFDNRMNDKICGRNARHFWPLDETYLKYSSICAMLSIGSGSMFLYAFEISNGYVLGFGALSGFINWMLVNIYKKKYFDANHIDEEDR
jgi:hypothetical protein